MNKPESALKNPAPEKKSARLSALTQADLRVLISYNRKTGHLLNYESDSGRVTGHSMEALRNRGTLQRLLDYKLIYPGGKLTPKGLDACERLQKSNLAQKTATGVDEKEPSLEKGHRPDSETVSQADLKETPGEPPLIDADNTVGAGQSGVDTELDGLFTPSDSADKPPAEDNGAYQPPAAALRVSSGDKLMYKNLVSLMSPQSYEAEQFKILRNNILFPVTGKVPRSILVTSAHQGEGKSFVAANLAVSIALNVNRHVLLIDCDLRKPDLHRLFGIANVDGLSDYLSDHHGLASLLRRTDVERLSLLPGGAVPPNPSELMSSERMSAMLEEVRQRYDDRLIVIDSPPPGMAAETSYLARQVDGILLVVEYGKTPREDVEDLMDAVGSEKILGAVINYLDGHVSKRYGYGKYGYGTYGNGKKGKKG